MINSNFIKSQTIRLPSSETPGQSFDKEVFVRQVDGTPFKQKYINVTGSPFLFDEFKKSFLIFADGRKAKDIKTRIDVCSNEVHFLDDNNKEQFLLAGTIKEVAYIDTLADGKIKVQQFVTNIPPVDNLTEKDFFEILINGKIILLKSDKRKINEIKNEMSGEKSSQFDDYIEYFVYTNGSIKRLKKDKDFISLFTVDKKEKMDAYLKEKKLSFKNVEDIKTFFAYYNSL